MGYPVLLIHGMWCTGADWNRVRELLEPRGYSCYTPNLPAHEPTPDQPLQVGDRSLRDYLAFLEAYVREQDFAQPPILVGHSMGGLLAQQLAARTRPLALVLLTPAAPRGINSLAWWTFKSFLRVFLRWGFWRKPHKPGFKRAAVSAFNGIAPERHAALYQRLVHESGRAACEIGLWPLDFSRASAVEASQVRCPVYVVSCGEDRLTPGHVVRKVAALYPAASQRHYPDRGHWVIDDEETEEMMHAICGWLRPLEQRSARGQKAPS